MLPLLSKLGQALAGGVTGRLSNVDRTALVVRSGRVLYAAGAGYIGTAWYVGWRNQRVQPGSGKFPLPGSKLPVIRPEGAPDAELGSADIHTPWRNGQGAAGYGDVAGPPTPSGGQVMGKGGSPNLLIEIAEVGRTAFRLRIAEHPKYGGVQAGHSPTSYHKRGRAFDATGDPRDMATFAHYVARKYGQSISELFWRGPNWVNIKDGRPVPRDFSGAMAARDRHERHVHVAI